MKAAIAAVLFVQTVSAAVGKWGQCGGTNYKGETTCVLGATCVYSNPWYSQCLPASSIASTTKIATTARTTTTSKISTTSTTTTSRTATTTSTSTSVPTVGTGFVKRSGQKFTLNGSPYTLVGHNAYWLAQLGSDSDINAAFVDIKNTGATTVRTWGFNEVTGASGTYYQIWSGTTPSVNTGSSGLAKFDAVVSYAESNGIRLIVALTNNWADYGGMDVYVKQILGSSNHDLFYTDSSVKAAFKKYINSFVGRYKNSPTILAWELANEPRCKGSTGAASGSCTPSTITSWIKEISAYIKSIDGNHLVAIGDEGFGLSGPTSYPYSENEGLNFATNLAISTIDFGVPFHCYPEHWGSESQADPVGWGNQWIKDHAAIQKALDKPVVFEEYGVSSDQYATYTTWLNTVVSSGLTGSLIWQAGSRLPSGTTHDDGYTIYPDDPVYPLLTAHAAALKSRDGSTNSSTTTSKSSTAPITSSKTSTTSITPTTTTTSKSSTTATTSSKSSTTTTSTATTTTNGPVPTGFVGRSGQKFILNGSTYTVVGHNAYWLAQLGSSADINSAFIDIKNTGATTVRTWGFNEVTSASGTYYQIWSGSTPSINTGSTGLAKFDTVVSYAQSNGLRLIVALTNNWADYGGMDTYVKQILGSSNHDLFYTDSAVKTAFKNYINAFVGRYKSNPTILAWELANEPRCKGSTGTSSGSCTTATITTWIKEMSSYIKSIDSNHLVAIGDEGMGLSGAEGYPYAESEGLNFATNLAISTVDFGVSFHAYPEHWGTESQSNPISWGNQWITDHVAIQKSLNKPVIFEEYGVTDGTQQLSTYTSWLNTAVSSGLTGTLIWQAGSRLSSGATHDDGYTIYPDDPVYPLLKSHAAALKARG